MCGIAGFVSPHTESFSFEHVIGEMAHAVLHRGPDSYGSWVDQESCIAVGHQRLAIQDLSDAGKQPMFSKSGVNVIVYNGEIYNHLELRKLIESIKPAVRWFGSSDTETLLEAVETFGITKTLSYLEGMFAFALWNRKSKKLILARDKFGEKPLYYGFQGNSFVFGSDLASLRLHPHFENYLNLGAVPLYLRHNVIPAPYSIYEGIYKLLPGSYLELGSEEYSRKLMPEIFTFWDARAVAEASRSNIFDGDFIDAKKAIDSALTGSVAGQMISDVPVGAFLSGGVDSSLIVSKMVEISSTPVNTFTIGSESSNSDESIIAAKVAEHLGTHHTSLVISSDDALDIVPKLPHVYSEPFADSSQIPTFLVSKLAREQVTVALSGDAGDELFAGYNRYSVAAKYWGRVTNYPKSVRRLGAKAISTIKPSTFDTLFDVLNPVIPRSKKIVAGGNKLHKFSRVLMLNSETDYYRALTSHFDNPLDFLMNSFEPQSLISSSIHDAQTETYIDWMMLLDTVTYLPDDILVKVDRAAMGNSLETRVPFLNSQLFELAWSLPNQFKVHKGRGKHVLRELLFEKVPKEIIDLPKRGFGVPVADWLRGPLREWAEELLAPQRVHSEGIFNSDKIQEMWNEHISTKKNHEHSLWTFLMFQAWLDSLETKPRLRN